MRTYKIKDLGRVVTGKTPSTKNKEFYNQNDFQFVCPPDIKNVRYVCKTVKYISSKAYKANKGLVCNKNSILIDCIGADMGNCAISIQPCLTNQQINSITDINTDVVSPLYLYYLFSTKKDYLQSIGKNGSTMPIINKSMFEALEFSLHNLSMQQHIVNTILILPLISL